MSFTRTTSGISNQHLFHDVDFIVFVEGGDICYSKAEVDAGNYSEESIDVLFWKRLLEEFKEKYKVKYKAIGSKTTILKIAEQIINNDLTTVYAAMDSEFDLILGKMLKHKNVLYTYGYSWENDGWNSNTLHKILEDLSAKKIPIIEVEKLYNKFLNEIKLSVYADAYQFSKSDSFIPRKGTMRFIECGINNETKLKKGEIETLIAEKHLSKPNLYSYGRRHKVEPKRFCYGHLFGNFCKHLLRYLLKTKYGLTGIGDEIIRRLVISNFIEYLELDVRQYYQEVLE